MAMGKRKRHAKQASMWVATQDLPRTPFYMRLNQILDQHDCDRYVRPATRNQSPVRLFSRLERLSMARSAIVDTGVGKMVFTTGC
jgi:hypothetical protein